MHALNLQNQNEDSLLLFPMMLKDKFCYGQREMIFQNMLPYQESGKPCLRVMLSRKTTRPEEVTGKITNLEL